MAETQRVVEQMFSRFLNLELGEEALSRFVPLVEKIEHSIRYDLDLSTVQGQNTLKVLLGTLLAYGWGLGMHPFNNPLEDQDGNPVEVRACRDILVPICDLQAIRYVKKDQYGRVKKALFEPDQNERVRSQIDTVLSDIAQSKWDEEEY